MSDEATVPIEQAADQGAAGNEPKEAVVAFCQQCGRALSASTRRQVGSAVFCQPCASAGAAPSAGWRPVNNGPSGTYNAPPTSASYPGAPPFTARRSGPGSPGEPALAGFLGLIPGVGAMYNGQYPKGAIHLIVFVVLVSLADNLNWVFWWFVWGWIFYQAFDAYHTAVARRDGQPLPDPFGWNELGERMGGGRNWPPGTNFAPPPPADPYYGDRRPDPSPYAPPAAPPYAPPVVPTAAHEASQPFVPFRSEPRTYASPTDVPPSMPGTAYAPVGVPPQTPYVPPYTSVSSPGTPVTPSNSRRFPVGAAWLIGLGVLFLLGNMLPSWQLEGRWLVPILLGALALWIGVQRMVSLRAASPILDDERAWPPINRVAGTLLGPALLATVAILLALQAGDVLPLRHSWPALLIVWGALQLLERAPAPLRADPDPLPAEQVGRSSADSR